MNKTSGKYIGVDWPAIPGINALSTTRSGGHGSYPYDSFNMGVHVGDKSEVVQANRELLIKELSLPSAPLWLDQIHGTDVIYGDRTTSGTPAADAAWTDQPGCVLSVMTADCLPVLLSSVSGDAIAVAHGGWRGLAGGILQKTVAALSVDPADLQAWLGPAIGPANFEVGPEVREAFVNQDENFTGSFVRSDQSSDKFFADIFELGRQCLLSAGVSRVYGGGLCTYNEESRFFSHRRDQGTTGRMTSVIWISNSD